MIRATLVVLTYNQRELALAAAESALAQASSEIEVIISVDAGDRETGRMVHERVQAAGSGIEVTVVAPEENRGPAWCYNEAVALARGEAISFLDGDDLWAEGMASCQLAALARAPAGVVGVVGRVSYPSGPRGEPRYYEPEAEDLAHIAVIRNGAKYPVLGALYRTATLRAVLPIPAHFKVCDYFVATRITGQGRLIPSECFCGEVQAWAGSMRTAAPPPDLTLDRLETLAELLRSPSRLVRGAARYRERRLLNSLIRNPHNLPIHRLQAYAVERRFSLRSATALTVGIIARRASTENSACSE